MSAPRFANWQQATHCTKGAGTGAKALMVGVLLRFIHAVNFGIFNCRDTALGNLSAHSEGRALDVGCNLRLGGRIVRFLLHMPGGPRMLGISVIIHNRVIYSKRSPNGRKYTGNPHTDHVHIELTRKAATNLKLRRVKKMLGLPL